MILYFLTLEYVRSYIAKFCKFIAICQYLTYNNILLTNSGVLTATSKFTTQILGDIRQYFPNTASTYKTTRLILLVGYS